jgi:hypothetical protein
LPSEPPIKIIKNFSRNHIPNRPDQEEKKKKNFSAKTTHIRPLLGNNRNKKKKFHSPVSISPQNSQQNSNPNNQKLAQETTSTHLANVRERIKILPHSHSGLTKSNPNKINWKIFQKTFTPFGLP